MKAVVPHVRVTGDLKTTLLSQQHPGQPAARHEWFDRPRWVRWAGLRTPQGGLAVLGAQGEDRVWGGGPPTVKGSSGISPDFILLPCPGLCGQGLPSEPRIPRLSNGDTSSPSSQGRWGRVGATRTSGSRRCLVSALLW